MIEFTKLNIRNEKLEKGISSGSHNRAPKCSCLCMSLRLNKMRTGGGVVKSQK